MVYLFFVSILLYACSASNFHTADSQLERRFVEHQSGFEALLAEVEMDADLESIQPGLVSYRRHLINVPQDGFVELERLGFTRERWAVDQRELQQLGLRGGVFKAARRVEFRVEAGSMFNGDSYKGYEYRLDPPHRLHPSLDRIGIAGRDSDSDRDQFGNWVFYKHLTANWYLYFFVNR